MTKTLIPRDLQILRQRKAGRTLQSLAVEYGLSRERVRQIEAGEKGSPQAQKPRLSHRAQDVVLRVLGRGYWPISKGGPVTRIAQSVAAAGKTAFVGRLDCDDTIIAEIERWIVKCGFAWTADPLNQQDETSDV